MSITIDTQSRRRFGSADYHHQMSAFSSQPHFSDPWAPGPSTATTSQPANQSHNMFATTNQDAAGLPHLNLAAIPRQAPPPPQHSPHAAHSSAASSPAMPNYTSLPVTAAPSGVYRQHDLLSMPSDPFTLNRLPQPVSSAAYDTAPYTTAGSPVATSYPTASSSSYAQITYSQAPLRDAFTIAHDEASRRYSQHSAGSGGPDFSLSDPGRTSLQPDDRRAGFREALEASHGMLAMSQETPRNIYDIRHRSRGSIDSYGFPSTHSSTSSISSTGFSGYYGGSVDGSVDGSVSDYSAASDIEPLSGNRALPRAQPQPQPHLMTQPPAPQSMMGSFSSRVSCNTQKKHKCKVCDKRFTRPSSLQTHMYSHTGEKRKLSL